MSAAVELAKVHIQDDELRKAIRLLTETTNARPEMAEVWGLLGRCLEKDGQTEAARDAMKQFAMVKAFNEKVVVAQKAFASGELQKAYVICRQLLNFLPNELRVLRLLAKIVRQLGHYEFSTSTLASCVETRPQLYLTFYTIRRMHFNVSGLRRFIFFNF